MTTAKKAYRVLPFHRDQVAGIDVIEGQILYLTDAEALYEQDLGFIEPADAGPPAPPTEPYAASTDTIILRRGSATRTLDPSELAAFFASILGGAPMTPPAAASLSLPTLLVTGAI